MVLSAAARNVYIVQGKLRRGKALHIHRARPLQCKPKTDIFRSQWTLNAVQHCFNDIVRC